MQEDADLDPIRDLPAFAEMMKVGHLDRQYTAVWTGDVRFEANPIVGLDPTAHLQRCRELESQGYRMVALSVARTSPEGPPVTASVWHRPVITDEIKDHLAERQARAAVALLRMGKVDEVLPLLRHSADPRLRSFIVNWLNPLGADPKVIAAELDRHPGDRQTDTRPGTAVHGCGAVPSRDLAAAGLDPGAGNLRHGGAIPRRAGAADQQAARPLPQRSRCGIHGAAEWTLRQWKQEEKLRNLDAELIKLKDRGDRRWFVNSQGQTFAVIEGPVEFRMGSPPDGSGSGY